MFKQLFSFHDRYRILHLTWFAFFLTFVDWFNFAPFATIVGQEFDLTPEQIKTLGICNLALTIPARIVIGMILDRFGPRITFSSLLLFSLLPCLTTALSQDFNQLVASRLLMGIVGSGFVVGIRMVSEWFSSREMGMAQGIYGGWGNFGASAAEFTLPFVAVGGAFLTGGAMNWRLSIALTGIISAIYGAIYYRQAQDTPPGKVYQKPKRGGGMEVTSIRSFWAMLVSNLGLILALGLLAWQLAQPNIYFLTHSQMYAVWVLLAGLYGYQSYQAWQVNRELLARKKTYSSTQRYCFRQVALLEFTYVTNFGSQLAAVSLLPAFFEHTFSLNHLSASLVAASYPLFNLFSRPSGGLISDKFGRKWTMALMTVGIGISYLLAYRIDRSWPLLGAIALILLAAYFAQAGSGATYAIVPLIKPEMTGQIAGNVGAYGNFGGLIYLTIYSLTNAQTLFQVMGITALICAMLCAFFLKEPNGFVVQHDTSAAALSRLGS